MMRLPSTPTRVMWAWRWRRYRRVLAPVAVMFAVVLTSFIAIAWLFLYCTSSMDGPRWIPQSFSGRFFSVGLGWGTVRDLPFPVMEINGNHAAAVLRYANNSTYSVHRLPEYDYEDSIGFYTTFNDVFVSGASSKVYAGQTVYFPGGCALDLDPFPIVKVRSVSPSDIVHLDHVVIVSQYWGEAFYHWVIEGLPKIALMLDYLQANPDAKILVKGQAVREPFFQLMDIGLDRIADYDPSKVYFARKAVAPMPSHCGDPIPPALTHLKNILREKVATKYPSLVETAQPKPFTIVVQSRGTACRSLTNHDELMAALRCSQPDAVVIEFGPNENVIATAAKHFNADVVVGPHGAGLSNIIFTPNGATLIETHPRTGNEATEGPHHVNGCHQRTARKSGMKSIMFLEDNGDSGTPFTANIARIVDAVARVRNGDDLDSLDRYLSWQF